MNRRDRRKFGLSGSEPQVRRMFQKVGRNDLCPCGSGLKFKKCSCFNHEKTYFDVKQLDEARDERNEENAEEAGD